MSQKVKLYNSPIFKTLLGNKLAQYLYCKDVMAPSWLADTPEELASIFSQTTDTDIVLKPLYGSGGKGILIGEKASLIKEPLEFPLLVQTFVPAKGIPGFSNPEELADLRLVYINHELIYAISRIAKPSSLFTNFHQGATAVMVPLEKIPSSALALADGIVKKLEVFSEANYALDLMFDLSLKPFLVEINTTPGFDLLREFGDKDTNQRYFQAFIKNIPL
jgi:glutathione synthase/RimK-type ligase-like ATP-grasp enzyme